MVELHLQDFEYNKKLFNQEKAKLQKFLPSQTPIDHVGSTAIPNMVGKNIIDILVGASNEQQFEELFNFICQAGYFPSKKKNPDYQFFASTEAETGNGDTHIHLAIIETERYSDFLSLRDYLLSNPDVAHQYSNLKKQLLEAGISNRSNYKKQKSEYVSALIIQAGKNSKEKK
ncbi:MAG: GrpB family protein [Clostridiales bacterium]|nr:GrpB family protein [Clostridiales bacterium]